MKEAWHTLNLKLFLKRESLRGERGEVGFETDGDFVALGVFLLWTLGLSLNVTVWEAVSAFVVQRKRGVEGLLPPERKPNRVQVLGLGLGLPGCLSDMVDAGSRVQKALLQPVPIFTVRATPQDSFYRSLSIAFYLCFPQREKKIAKKTSFVLFWSVWRWHRRQTSLARGAWDQTKTKLRDKGKRDSD